MTDTTRIRAAAPPDVCFVGQDGYLPAEEVRRKIERREVFVATRDSAPVGYLRLEYPWSRVPCIALVWVLPRHRRQGIGRALLRHVEGFLHDRSHRHGTGTWDSRSAAS